ncbi:MAG: hypothetical protein IJW76_05390 [Clostridia bacterium]|nr:hypothetical protein [Clostridia bacterium]
MAMPYAQNDTRRRLEARRRYGFGKFNESTQRGAFFSHGAACRARTVEDAVPQNNLTLRSRQKRKQSFIILTYKKVNAVSSFAERYFVDKSF